MALYKNWPEICKIGRHDPLLMLVLASASLNEDNDLTQRLFIGFPECFSTEKIIGPFPLSVIRHEAAEFGRLNCDVLDGADYPNTYEALDGVPFVYFEVLAEGESPEPFGSNYPIFPKAQAQTLKQGDTCEWEGKPMVVLEVGRDCQRLTLAPAECIALDL